VIFLAEPSGCDVPDGPSRTGVLARDPRGKGEV
jgi:hypothetical protein